MIFHIKLVRLPGARNFGHLVLGDLLMVDSLEDTDRKLEAGGIKVPGETAIPRGTYEIIVDYSPKFKKYLPRVLEVPQFSGVRIHGGADEGDTEGCILVGVRAGDRLTKGIQTSATVTALLSKMQADGYKLQLEVI